MTVALTLSLACGAPGDTTGPIPPAPPPPPAPAAVPVALRITGDGAAFLDAGQTRFMQATLLMSDSSVVPIRSNLSWTSRDSAHASMLPSGEVRAGDVIGATWLVAQHQALVDSFAIWVQPPASEPSTFHITLLYPEGEVPQRWKTALESAARRWEQVIRRPLPPVDLTSLSNSCPSIPLPARDTMEQGTVVFVLAPYTPRPGERLALGWGGRCSVRARPLRTTATGWVTVNKEWIDTTTADHLVQHVAVHEIGHVLGLAGICAAPHIECQYAGGEFVGSLNHGPFTRYGFFAQTRERVASVAGDEGSHWPKPLDVMTGADKINLIGLTSIGALMDLGYPATAHGAGVF